MNVYSSEAVDFFVLVLTSGAIALTALAVASAFAFTIAFGLFRESATASLEHRTVVETAGPVRGEFESRPMPAVTAA
jgi:uncharacterized membrane protein SpoIIM required for sporulation